MSRLKVPSLQHLARNYADNSSEICRKLVQLVRGSPNFNYNPLFSAVRDLLLLKMNYEQVEEGIRRYIRREDIRENFLEVLPLLHKHFRDVSPDFVNSISTRNYAVGPRLLVPFTPPIMYGVGGQLYFPWFSFWRSNPLGKENLSLFVTAVFELLEQDPDLENARFQILDFSAAPTIKQRTLKILEANDIPRLSDDRKKEMLEVFADGYAMAKTVLAQEEAESPGDDVRESPIDDEDQPDLFD